MLTTEKTDPIANLSPEQKALLTQRFMRFKDNLEGAIELRKEIAITEKISSKFRHRNPLILGFK